MNLKRKFSKLLKILLCTTLTGWLGFSALQPVRAATQFDILGPTGSGYFGTSVTVLTNGNIVVTDPSFYLDGKYQVGAVHLYNGANGDLISSLTGTTAYDQVGSGKVIPLSNGNFLVHSPLWDNGSIVDAGAVTWVDGLLGLTGEVSAANSLMGSAASEQTGSGGVIALSNGNYLVRSPNWDNGSALDAGAVTWGDGFIGVSGLISPANSLVGSQSGDLVGSAGVTLLSNGNYLVSSTNWDNGAIQDAGAVTWGSGTNGVFGPVSAANSLVGTSAGEQVGNGGVALLTNGNYLVRSPYWDNGEALDAGAVTWGNGATGVVGAVSYTNSLVGTTTGDQVGSAGVTPLTSISDRITPDQDLNGALDKLAVPDPKSPESGTTIDPQDTIGLTLEVSDSAMADSTTGVQIGNPGVVALTNGNYLVRSPYWDNAGVQDAGAVTWGNGATGTSGFVNPSTSLVGGKALDQVGNGSVFPLSNGNYVVSSPNWDNIAVVDAGAATWGSGVSGKQGFVSAVNSLVGSADEDVISSGGVTPLSNGNFVVSSPDWKNGYEWYAGAATWGSGNTGVVGVVSSSNSLVGSGGDEVSSGGVFALTNGHYVVSSPWWGNNIAYNIGAVTWGNGSLGTIGLVSTSNSLVGSMSGDRVGGGGIFPLSNGNYIVSSPDWDNGAAQDAGAVTWRNGSMPSPVVVSSTNSLVGGKPDDRVGSIWYSYPGVLALSNGNYLVSSPEWDNGAVIDAGAVTWGSGLLGVKGAVSAANSLVGSSEDDQIGYDGWSDYPRITLLSNGNYVVSSPYWNNGSVVDAGAVTWGSGASGVTGAISIANSLVGSTTDDRIGYSWIDVKPGITPLDIGNYLVFSPSWDNGSMQDAGAVTWAYGTSAVSGSITSTNSVRGMTFYRGDYMNFQYDPVNNQLVVGRPFEDIVTLFNLGSMQSIFLPMITK